MQALSRSWGLYPSRESYSGALGFDIRGIDSSFSQIVYCASGITRVEIGHGKEKKESQSGW